MTIAELPKLLQALGFNYQVTPARRDSITLLNIEYDSIDEYWRVRFGWEDMEVPGRAVDLPTDVLEVVARYAHHGTDSIMIFIWGNYVRFREDDDWLAIEAACREELRRLTIEAETIAKAIAPFC